MEFRDQMKILIQLSLIDNQLSSVEKSTIYSLGKANNIPEREIDDLFEELLACKTLELPEVISLAEEDKLDYLCNIVQLMKVDKKVYLSEIKFCQELAVKLGYKKKVVSKLSSRIFSDPSLGSSRKVLKALIDKNKLD